MLVIRMQRTGRKGHAMFRIVVQDSRQTPTSGKVVASLGSYDPHAKVVVLDKEKAAKYLQDGAQPSDRVIRILRAEKVSLPSWVVASAEQKGAIRHPEKLRRNQPKAAVPAEEAQPVVEEPVADDVKSDADAPEAEE